MKHSRLFEDVNLPKLDLSKAKQNIYRSLFKDVAKALPKIALKSYDVMFFVVASSFSKTEKQIVDGLKKILNQHEDDPLAALEETRKFLSKALDNPDLNDKAKHLLTSFYHAFYKTVDALSKSESFEKFVEYDLPAMIDSDEAFGRLHDQSFHMDIDTYTEIVSLKREIIKKLIRSFAILIVSFYILIKITHENHPLKALKKAIAYLKDKHIPFGVKFLIAVLLIYIVANSLMIVKSVKWYIKLKEQERDFLSSEDW